MFGSTENKNKIEDGNRVLIQNFHTQLVQQLEILHYAVESSVEQHQQQLKVIKENTHSFVSEKDRVKKNSHFCFDILGWQLNLSPDI